MKIEKYSDIYPLTIICDRYSGTYSGGEYLAFNLDFCEIPQAVLGDDTTAMEFWDYYSKDYIVGKGRTVSQALLDLYMKLKNGEQPMELNKEQIIKALECCASEKYICEQCPIEQKIKDDCECGEVVARNALALIKELTEENERLRAEKEAENKELFHRWKKIADETADRYEGLYQDAKKSLVASTVRNMQERLRARRVSYGNITFKVVPIDDIDQIAKEMVEGEK
jgi:hypothetical protein